MNNHDQFLNMLKGKSSGNPMGFDAFVELSGLQPDTLNMVLDQLYEQRHINQAYVTRNGIQQRQVWPTGLVAPVVYQSAAGRVAPTPPPRRNEVTRKKWRKT